MTLRAAIYCRVSSATQRDAHTIENQLRTLPAFVAQQGWQLVGTYVDDGRSAKTGALERRDGFARLLRDAEARRFDVVVVVDVDRLTRSDSLEERALILGPFQRLGIDIVTPSGGRLDMRTMFGELWITILAIGAAHERKKIVERTKAGRTRIVAEGKKPSGITPYGLAYDRVSGRWSIVPERAAIAREILARIIRGESCRQIADDLRERDIPGLRTPWCRSAVWRIATSRHLIGAWRTHGTVVEVPAIADVSTWQRAQAALAADGTRGVSKSKHVYLLEGLGVCGACGAPMQIRTGTLRGDGYYRSAGYICRDRRGHERRDAKCTAPILPVEATDALVWETVQRALTTGAIVEAMRAQYEARTENHRDYSADVAKYEARLVRAEEAAAKIAQRFRRGLLSEAAFDLELAAAAKERRTIEAQLETARDAVRANETPRATIDALFEELRSMATTEDPSDRQRAVRLAIQRATFHGDELDLGISDVLVRSQSVVSLSQARWETRRMADVRIRIVARRMRGS